MHAMDMYRAQLHSLMPAPAAGLTAAGWQVVAYVTGTDTVVRDAVPGPLQMRTTTTRYGFPARNAAGELVVVIRGTDGFVEWIEDAEFCPDPLQAGDCAAGGNFPENGRILGPETGESTIAKEIVGFLAGVVPV